MMRQEIDWANLSDSDGAWEWYQPQGSMTIWTHNGLACWLKEKNLDGFIREVSTKKVNGRVLLCLLNNGGLGTLGIVSLVDITALLWAVEDLIRNKGDQAAAACLSPDLFENVPQAANRLAEEAQKEYQALFSLSHPRDGKQLPLPPNPELEENKMDGEAVPTKPPPVPPGVDSVQGGPVAADSEAFEAFLSSGERYTKESGNNEQKVEESLQTQVCDSAVGNDSEQANGILDESSEDLEPFFYEVVFFDRGSLHLILQEDGIKVKVKGFPKLADGSKGHAERSGKIEIGDFVIGVNNFTFSKSVGFRAAVDSIRSAAWPLVLRFKREPYLRTEVSTHLKVFTASQLKFVLLEAGVAWKKKATESELLQLAVATFKGQAKLPLVPGPLKTNGGASTLLAGNIAIEGWVLLQGPHASYISPEESDGKEGNAPRWASGGFTRCYLILQGTELSYYAPKGDGIGFQDEAEGMLNMLQIQIVEVTRMSEAGSKMLRLVSEEDEVWRLAPENDEWLKGWHTRLSLAQLLGPGLRSSGESMPSAPVLLNRTAQSLTVSWLPPMPRYLSSVRYFQVNYQKGLFGISRVASDEVHSTKFTIEGLEPDTVYLVNVRSCHELSSSGSTMWSEWSDLSLEMKTEKHRYGPMRRPEHLWVLVSGRLGQPHDFNYLKEQIEGRFGATTKVHVSMAVRGMQTQKGIHHTGDLLFHEISPLIDRIHSLRKVSFIAHDTGGLTVRYCLRLLDEKSLLNRVQCENFVTFGTPHLGHTNGPIARFLTGVQLRLEDSGPKPPLLVRMAQPDYLGPLRKFKRRLCYANVRTAAFVDYPTAAVRPDHPYIKVPESQLESLCSPHYQFVMLSTPAQATAQPLASEKYDPRSSALRNFLQFQHLWPGNSYANAQHIDKQETFVEMVQSLQSVGWQNIDVYNPGLLAHSDLIVKNAAVNKNGHSIISHLIDTIGEHSSAIASHRHLQTTDDSM